MRNRKHIKKYQGGGVSGLGVLPRASDIAFQPVVGTLPLNTGVEFARGLQQALQAQQVQAQLRQQQLAQEERNQAQRRLINNALVQVSDPIFKLKTYTPGQREELERIASEEGITLGELPPSGTIDDLEDFTRRVQRVTARQDFRNLVGETAAAEESFKLAQDLYKKDPNLFDINTYNKAVDAYRAGQGDFQSIIPTQFLRQPSFEEEAFNKLSGQDRLELARAFKEQGGDPNDIQGMVEFYMTRPQPTEDYFTQFFGDNMTETESRIAAEGRRRILEGTLDPENEIDILGFISEEYDRVGSQSRTGKVYSSNPDVNAYLSDPAITTERRNDILEEIDDKGLDITDLGDVELAHANVRGRKKSTPGKSIYSDCADCRIIQKMWDKYGMTTTSDDAEIAIRKLAKLPGSLETQDLTTLITEYPQFFPDRVRRVLEEYPEIIPNVQNIDNGVIKTDLSGDAADLAQRQLDALDPFNRLEYDASMVKGKLVLKPRPNDLPRVEDLENMDFGTAPAPTAIFDAIRQVESGGNYNILQGESAPGVGTERGISSASGGYQFLWGDHGDAIKAVTGIEPSPLTAEDKARFKQNPKLKDLSDRELAYVKTFVNSPEAQEAYMLHQYRTQYLPVLSDYLELNDGRYSTPELIYIMHHEGVEGGKTFLRTGKSSHDTKNRNVTTELTQALSKLKKAINTSEIPTIRIDEGTAPADTTSRPQTINDLINSFNR